VFSGAYVAAAAPMPYPMIPTSGPPALSPVPLPPNEQGYVRVDVNSGSTGCSVNTDWLLVRRRQATGAAPTDDRTIRSASTLTVKYIGQTVIWERSPAVSRWTTRLTALRAGTSS
jgi:hypothetical protein